MRIVSHFVQFYTFPGQVLISNKEFADSFYFINKGKALLLDGNTLEREFLALPKGSYFGDCSILLGIKSSISYVADDRKMAKFFRLEIK